MITTGSYQRIVSAAITLSWLGTNSSQKEGLHLIRFPNFFQTSIRDLWIENGYVLPLSLARLTSSGSESSGKPQGHQVERLSHENMTQHGELKASAIHQFYGLPDNDIAPFRAQDCVGGQKLMMMLQFNGQKKRVGEDEYENDDDESESDESI
ncbi:hypothetical protein K7X08_011595 [Anisodus acutangulus]|uniref:Uncharacterized protein n=1 Tax=Anisodus acutangulus TaxID=402998 RepID=A0A9Q1MNR9_9SOLA|nr:hypothetical protein K7X08_011595 [Anisodus acutangulus]